MHPSCILLATKHGTKNAQLLFFLFAVHLFYFNLFRCADVNVMACFIIAVSNVLSQLCKEHQTYKGNFSQGFHHLEVTTSNYLAFLG